MMTISIGPALHPSHDITDLKTRRRDPVLHELARRAHSCGAVHDPELLHALLLMRERLGPTAIGRGVAIPNLRSLTVGSSRLLVGRSRRGVEWGGAEPVHLVLMALSPAEVSAGAHHDLVARAVAATRLARTRQRLLEAEHAEEVALLLREAMA